MMLRERLIAAAAATVQEVRATTREASEKFHLKATEHHEIWHVIIIGAHDHNTIALIVLAFSYIKRTLFI